MCKSYITVVFIIYVTIHLLCWQFVTPLVYLALLCGVSSCLCHDIGTVVYCCIVLVPLVQHRFRIGPIFIHLNKKKKIPNTLQYICSRNICFLKYMFFIMFLRAVLRTNGTQPAIGVRRRICSVFRFILLMYSTYECSCSLLFNQCSCFLLLNS